MQSRLASRSYLVVFGAQKQGLIRRMASGVTVKGRTADPTIHSGELEAGPDVHRGEPQGIDNSSESHKLNEFRTESESESEAGYVANPSTKPKMPHDSSPKIKSFPVNHPIEPNVHQRRGVTGSGSRAAQLEDVSCAGLDGSPYPNAIEDDKKQQVMNDREYYSDHKASPLSEIEMEDTRKPITRATDGTATAVDQNKRDLIGWLPEQLDTVEEALLRATRIWEENAMRGIPEAPHSRVLRELRGEWF